MLTTGSLLAAAGLGAGISALSNYDSQVGLLGRAAQKLQLSGSKKEQKRAVQLQQKYDRWKSKLDYQYAEQYARNSAKWQMEGLRNAGMNPILAVTGGSMGGTFGPASSGSIPSGHNLHSAKSSDPVSSASQLASTAKEAALIDAQIENVHANTDNIKQDTLNKANTNGLTGHDAAISVLANKLGIDHGNSAKSSKNDLTPSVAVQKAVHSAKRLGNMLRPLIPEGSGASDDETRRHFMQQQFNPQRRRAMFVR